MSHPHPTSPSAPHGLWRQTVVLRPTHGQEEAISVGPDGIVWSFQAGGASGPRLQSLELPADFVTAGRAAHGRWVVVAVKGLQLQYRTEAAQLGQAGTSLTACRWTAAQPIVLPNIVGAVGVRKLYAHADSGGLRIALIVDTWTPEAGASYVLASCLWTAQGPGPFVLLSHSLKREVSLHTTHTTPRTKRRATNLPQQQTLALVQLQGQSIRVRQKSE